MDVSKEIKYRLKAISILLKEIECILNGRDTEIETEFSEDCLCTCVCGQESIPELFPAKPNQTKDDHSKRVGLKSMPLKRPEEHVKYKGLDKEDNTFNGDNDIEICATGNYKRNHEKGNNLHQNAGCNNTSNKRLNSVSMDCSNENFKRKLKDIRQRFLAQFQEINKE